MRVLCPGKSGGRPCRQGGVASFSPDGSGGAAGAGLVSPAPPRPEQAPSSGAPEAWEAILRAARRLTAARHRHEVLRLATTAACEALGYGVCAAALRAEDGAFRYEMLAGGTAEQERELRGRLVSATAFDLLMGASLPIGAVRWVPPESLVRHHPEVEAALLRTGTSAPAGTWRRGSLLVVPLVDEAGGVVGFLSPDDPRSGDLPGGAEALLLGSLAELTEIALETIAARDGARQAVAVAEAQRRQLEDLLTASVAVRGREALDDVLTEIARVLTSAGGFRRAAVYLLEEDRETLRVRATVGLDALEDRRLRETPVALAEFAAVMRPDMHVSRSYLFDHRRHDVPSELDEKLSTPDADPDWVDGMWHAQDMLTVPLVDRGGTLLGLISVDEPLSGRLPGLAHIRAVEMFADQCSLAVGEARRYEQAVAEAGTDPLTGLPNRRALLARAAELLADGERRGVPCAVVFLDIDHFKEVNDRWGHAVGDDVLVAVSAAMAARLRAGDLIARYGGEEFVVVLSGTTLEDAVGIVEELRRRVAAVEVPRLAGYRVRISGGVALVRPGEALADAFGRADAALYAAKRAGRDRLRVADAA